MNMWTNPSVSKKMLERYSHIRTQAKKAAIATLDQFGSKAQNDSILGEIGHKNGHSQCAEASGDSPNSLETNGGPTRTRTWDQRIMSPALCQLSYGPVLYLQQVASESDPRLSLLLSKCRDRVY